MNEQSEDKCDRELFSEVLEPPIYLLLIHIVSPFIEENNPVFILHTNERWSSLEIERLFAFGNRAKSNILFTVIDLDRLIIKHSTELDNRPFGTRTIGVSLGSITEQFDWICGDRLLGQRSPCSLVFGFAYDVTKEKLVYSNKVRNKSGLCRTKQRQ